MELKEVSTGKNSRQNSTMNPTLKRRGAARELALLLFLVLALTSCGNPPKRTFIKSLSTGFFSSRFLYFDCPKHRFYLYHPEGEMVPPCPEHRKISFQCTQKIPLRDLQFIKGSTILVFESNSTAFHSKHLFHFLEHALGFWSFGGEKEPKTIKRFLFVGTGRKIEESEWIGSNQTTLHIIRALFPNAQIMQWRDFIQEYKGKLLCFDHVIASDRSLEIYRKEPYRIERYLGGYVQNLSKESVSRFVEAVHLYSKANLQPLDKLKITYVTRQGIRSLAPRQEEALFKAIRTIPNVIFDVVDFAQMSFQSQVQIAAQTDVLLGVHGNGLSHTLFLKEGSTLIELFPEDTFRAEYQIFAKLRNVDYFGWTPGLGWIDVEKAETIGWHGDTVEKPLFEIDIDTTVSLITEKIKHTIHKK